MWWGEVPGISRLYEVVTVFIYVLKRRRERKYGCAVNCRPFHNKVVRPTDSTYRSPPLLHYAISHAGICRWIVSAAASIVPRFIVSVSVGGGLNNRKT